MVFKKHLTRLSKNGSIVKHAGKGHSPFQPPPQPSLNDYAKAMPLPQAPSPAQDVDMDGM